MTTTTPKDAPPANGNGPQGDQAPAPDPARFGEPGTGSLDERLARITGLLHVQADRKMDTGGRNFAYASIDALSAALDPLLAAERVTILPTNIATERDVVEREKDSKDGAYKQYRYHAFTRITWRVACPEGEPLNLTSEGYSADPEGSEKHVNQAVSFARINLYKTMFHIATGDDPENPGGGSGGGGGGGFASTGELPAIPTMTGSVLVGSDGQIGVKAKTEYGNDADFNAQKDLWKGLGGRYEKEPKVWVFPADKAELVVDVARGYGLTISAPLAERFPVKPAAPADDLAGDPGPESGQPSGSDDESPF